MLIELTIGVLILLVIGFKWKKAKTLKARLALAPQEPVPEIPAQDIGSPDVPLLHGIRVVELATVVAVPTSGLLMAHLGAEVLKIEEPKGDMWRKFLLQYQTGNMDDSAMFHSTNSGKLSVCLDLKKSDDMKTFKKILADADVLLTNIRTAGLETLGLTYPEVHKEFPHLVYAHLSAWGATGEDSGLPGYDLGAFWATSGMASKMHYTDGYSVYPLAMGDVISGTNLFAGVVSALRQRIDTGQGNYVCNSLMSSGIFSMSPLISTALNSRDYKLNNQDQEEQIRPFETFESKNPFRNHYITKDEQIVCLTGLGKEEQQEKIIRSFLHDLDFDLHSGLYTSLTEAVGTLDLSTVETEFKERGVLYAKVETFVHTYTETMDDPIYSQCWRKVSDPELAKDVPYLPNMPFQASCSTRHCVQRAAPKKGAHTDVFRDGGWSERSASACLPIDNNSQDDKKSLQLPFADVTVVEWSGVGCECAAASKQLLELGATVYKVVDKKGDYWENEDEALFFQFNHDKKIVEFDRKNAKSLLNILSKANCFLTNIPENELEELGLDYGTLSEQFPSLVYLHSTPFGPNCPEHLSNAGGYGAFFIASGIANSFGKLPARPPGFPTQLGEVFTSQFVFAAVSAGLFHQNRTNQGQRLDISILRMTWFMCSCSISLAQKDVQVVKMFEKDAKSMWAVHPVFTANCFQSKDGQWFQFLGVEIGRHAMKVIKALGIGLKVWPWVVPTLLCKVIPNKAISKMERLGPLFELFNRAISSKVRSMTKKECIALFQEKDIWYCEIRDPMSVACYHQAQNCYAEHADSGRRYVKSPLQFGWNQ